jgi:hypothetical protein
MESKSDKNNWLGIAGLLVAIITLVFGDNLYQQLTGNSFFSDNSNIPPTEIIFSIPATNIPYIPTETPTYSPVNFLSSINAKIVSVKFFETSKDVLPLSERVYSTSFKQETTRFINWQLELELPPLGRRVDYVIHAIYYKSDGSIFWEQDSKLYILADWDNPILTKGAGSDNADVWTRDTYTVVLYIDNVEIARGTFAIE